MKQDNDILSKVGRRDGMTVPEGYFADFAAHMADSLPHLEFENPAAAIAKPRTLWQRIRPYAYMAAMFAGVWCMLKMFTLMTNIDDNSMQPSPVLAEALSNETFVNDYLLDDLNQWDLMDELMDDGFSIDDFDIHDDAFILTNDSMQ